MVYAVGSSDRLGSSIRSTSSVLCFALFTCALSPPLAAVVTTYSAAPALVVPDVSTRTTTITVPDFGIITDLDVTAVTFKLPNMADAALRLTDPSGTVTVQLMGGDFGVGDGIINCSFNDEGGSLLPGFLTNGVCRSDLKFTPDEALSAFDGLQIHGVWTLEASDSNGPDASDCDCDGFVVGPACPRTLDNWAMQITYTPSPVCTTVAVANQTIDFTKTYQACGTATVGPNLTLLNPANLRVYGGDRVVFENGFSAQQNTSLTAGVCGYDLCSLGGFRAATCMPCVGDICAVDPWCCSISWDIICVDEVESVCGLDCP